MIIDSQVHMWEADRPDRPWPPYHHLGSHHPEADPPMEPAEQLAAMDEIGVDRAIIVPPSWVGESNASAMQWSQEHPDRFRVMGLFDMALPDAPERLEKWLDQPGMLGIRAGFPREGGPSWIEPDSYPWFWSTAERLGIPIMISPPGGATSLVPILERHPKLVFIIDHLGLSPHWTLHPEDDPIPNRNFFGEDFEKVLEVARYPSVAVKFSSLSRVAKEPYPYPTMKPHLERAFNAYGPDRIMWGSDYSVLKSVGLGYRECLDHVRIELDFLSDSDREAILGGTAARILNWPI